MSKIQLRESPFRLIGILYLALSAVFTAIYLMPASLQQPLSFVDAWFLSASAMSVTGLTPISINEHLSVFGQTALLIQIQLGGIGIMVVLGALVMLFTQNLSLSQQTLMSLDQNQKGLKSIKKLVLFIVLFTFVLEFIGFLIFFPTIHAVYPDGPTAAFISLFHAVTTFTGAGFDLFGDSLIGFSGNTPFILTSAVLIFLGAIGFPTLLDVLASKGKKKTLYTKVNLFTHFALLLAGFVLFLNFEFFGSFAPLGVKEKVLNALFLSVTSRNAGLTSVDLSLLSSSSLFLLLMLMFIGGSASSCAGGIRTTTFAVLVAKMASIVKRREDVVLFKKSLYEDDINKSFLVFFVFLGLFLFSSLFLAHIEELPFEHLLFEVMSALTTTGLSIGITEDLSAFSKVWLSVLMIIGRVGIIAMIYTLVKPKKTTTTHVKEHLIVG